MAVVAHLVEKDIDSGDMVIDGVAAVVIGVDTAVDTTDALIQARAVTVLNALLGSGKFPTGYFTSNRGVAATYVTAGDVTVLNGRNVAESIT